MDFSTPPKAARAFLEVLSSKDFKSLSNLIHPKSTDPTAAAIRDQKVPTTDLEAAAATLGVFEEIISETEEKSDPNRKGWVKVRYWSTVAGEATKRRIYMAKDITVWKVIAL